MADDTRRFERDPAEGAPATTEQEPQGAEGRKPSEYGGVPPETFPPFDDPAFSSIPAEPPPADANDRREPPKDSEYEGHPEFSQDAAENKLPPGEFGNSEPVDDANEKTRHSDGQNPPMEQAAGAGPAIAERSRDARAPQGRQPGAYTGDDPLPNAPDGLPAPNRVPESDGSL